jgi:hypothetical protein
MRKRRKSAPLIVEHRHHRRSPAAPIVPQPQPAPPRAAPDRKIRAWNADDREARELEAFNRKTDVEQKEAAIAAACEVLKARLHRPNDPSVYQELARREVDCWAVGNSLSHVVEVPRPSDGSPRHYRLYAVDAASKAVHAPHHARLGKSLFALWPNAKRIVSDPKAPKKPRWWDCLKDMRKRTGEL